jgi:hypothetical protein
MPAAETITSVSQFLEWVINNCSGPTLFRGQADAVWSLLPRIARIPTRSGGPKRAERQFLNEFKRRSHPHLVTPPSENLEWMALAQHHGLPTRLMDWSTNPLVALWFACHNHLNYEKAGRAAVWAFYPDHSVTLGLDEVLLDPFDRKDVVVVYPPVISPRISSQSGCFTLQPLTSSGTYAGEAEMGHLLHKVVIPRSCMSTINANLDRCGVNEYTMFPGIDGLAKYLVWQDLNEPL